MSNSQTYLNHLCFGDSPNDMNPHLYELSKALHQPDKFHFFVRGRYNPIELSGGVGLKNVQTPEDASAGIFLDREEGLIREEKSHRIAGRMDTDGRLYAYLGEGGGSPIFEEVALVDGGDMVLLRGYDDHAGVYQPNVAFSHLLKARRIFSESGSLNRVDVISRLDAATGLTDRIKAAEGKGEAER